MKKLLGIFGILIFVSCGGDDGLSFEEQLAIDIATIDSYLDENNIDAQIHSTGIRYVNRTEGTGRTPMPTEVVVIRYDLVLLGTDEVVGLSEFGDSFIMDDNLMRALFFLLQEMKEGGEMTIYSPSGYAFGGASNSLIPPNSNIEINVELLSVIRTEAEQFAADTAIIDRFLDANEIDALIHPTGIRYTVLSVGSGDSPDPSGQVNISYEGRLLNGRVFDQSLEGTSFSINRLIEAWQIMIPTMKPGGRITIYAPSTYCYGPDGALDGFGNVVIPPNANLIFDIDLIAIE